jgi:hypothetical protein
MNTTSTFRIIRSTINAGCRLKKYNRLQPSEVSKKRSEFDKDRLESRKLFVKNELNKQQVIIDLQTKNHFKIE